MNLLEGDEGEFSYAECGLKSDAVFEDIFTGVPFDKTKIQDALFAQFAVPAGASAKTVDEPGDFGQGSALKKMDAADLAIDPTAG